MGGACGRGRGVRAALRCLGAALCAALVPLAAAPAPPAAAPPAAPAVNWAYGATAVASNSGHWAGFTAEPGYALDGDEATFWSSTGGEVCCSESRPGWLLVSLGAVRPLAALRLVYTQDMTYAFSVANASEGPFTQVARKTCEVCEMNYNLGSGLQQSEASGWRLRTLHQLAPPVAAAFVRLTITWSTAGGVGGCNDLCDWATDVCELQIYSPGVVPPPVGRTVTPTPSPPVPLACADADAVSQADMERSMILTGDAVRRPEGTGMRGMSSVTLTPPEQQRFGAVEYARIIRPTQSCSWATENVLSIKAYVWLGGGTTMPGEGLALSLVDARRQTPGKTVFKRGCGSRPMLPEASVSIVLDSSDSDPRCDEPGAGARVVASLDGGDAAPLVMCSSLDMSSAAYRKGEWVPLQIEMRDSTPLAGNSDALNGTDRFVIWHVWLNGTEILYPVALLNYHAPRIRAANVSLESFYIVVSARTGALSSDGHAVSGLSVERWPDRTPVENWDGYRQPLTPPPPAPPQISQTPAAVRSPAQLGAVSFGAALVCTLAFLLAATVAAHQLRQPAAPAKRAALEAVVTPTSDETWLLSAPPVAHQQPSVAATEEADAEFHVFLSYRRVDALLIDAVYDKLRLAGLRVFKDVDGFMAGKPFDAELVRVMRAAPVFAPVVTLASLQRLASAAAQDADFFLAELLVALCLREAGDICLIHPLLVGAQTEAGSATQSRTSLTDEPAYAAALAALPTVASAPAAAAVDSALLRAGAAPMPPHIAALSVREVLLGRPAVQGGPPAVAGVLGSAPFVLACSVHDLGLHISRLYAPPIWDALRKRAPLT